MAPRFFLSCLALCMVLAAGCVRQFGPEDMDVFRQGRLNWQADAEIAPVIYVGCRDESRKVAQLRDMAGSWLERKGFATTDNPSKAGYIVQVTLLAVGPASRESLRRAVESGYGAPAALEGGGSTVLLADVLLVQRRIPSHKRPSRARMKNVSRRNAVDNSQLRIGLALGHELREGSSLPGVFADVLGRELSMGLPLPQQDDSDQADKPS